MAIALIPFASLCGFLSLPTIPRYPSSTSELAALVPPSITKCFHQLTQAASMDADAPAPAVHAVLCDIFTAVMTTDGALVQTQLTARYAAGPARLQ